MINIIIIDDSNISIRGIEAILTRNTRYKVVATFPSLDPVITWNRQNKANVILINREHCHFDSLKTFMTIRRTQPDVGLIIFNIRHNDMFVVKALDIGIFGILSASIAEEELIEALQIVNARQRIISPDIAQQLALQRLNQREQLDIYELLSARELEIMLMITRGLPVKHIAESLSLSPKTVNTYRYRMFGKLNICSDVELTHIAIGYGLITAKQGSSGWNNSLIQKFS
ncbi:LuxR C-terminal-related transcriptional regulator [Providencia alcalifaciens]|uniref:LuxR C-terminal-related transcriptional regulator n=1 Tax=Providencia sp. wls1914 TaxID=2675156 RepID=UPI0012B5607C|nr:LuxR C-terminal-related transcriptional regulator [Providencia sp. wls1914]MTC72051.1 response regulator [Providencia sp. wls1914]